MNNQTLSQVTKKTSFRKRILFGFFGLTTLCALCGFSIFAFVFWGGGGEPATLAVAMRVDQEFLQAIHNQNIDSAYEMLSEKFIPQISKEQFSALIQSDKRIFSTYESFDVCDWGFFISDGRVITSSGLLHYEDGTIVVEISLHKDADHAWRVQGFRFRSDISPTPYGLCQ